MRPSRPRSFARRSPLVLAILALAALPLAGCGPEEEPEVPAPIRLADLAARGELEIVGSAVREPSSPVEWTFDAAPDDPAAGWIEGPGFSSLEARDGRLVGTSSEDFPVIVLPAGDRVPEGGVLHSVEVRMRASAGSNVSASFFSGETLDVDRDMGRVMAQADLVRWRVASPMVAGPELFTYTLDASKNPMPVPAEAIRYLLLRPTDASGAEVEIDAVRLVFRRDQLARIDSGLSWQGLGEIFHETLVARSPEVLRARIRVPEEPRFHLAVGTVEEVPVTFEVRVAPAGGEDPGAAPAVSRHTVSTPNVWEALEIDLAEHAGDEVVLDLALRADDEGTLGFWGSPAIHPSWDVRTPGDGRGGAEKVKSPPRGVIVILADTLRRDHMALYGYERETDPALRRLAAEGTVFEDAVVEATWTKASAPSLFTGLHPPTHGVLDFDHRLPASAETIGELFREDGRSTLLLSSILFTGRFSNLHQGFEEVHESTSLESRRTSKTASELVDRLIPWLERRRDTPYFVVLHVLDPHDPYRPEPPYDTLWADPARAAEHAERVPQVRARIQDPLLQVFNMPSRDEVAAAGFDPEEYIQLDIDHYDGAIKGMDDALGRLFDHLRESGQADSTVIAFTSDHGEEFFDHGRTFHGQSVYSELADVPLVLWGPGRIPSDRTVDRTVQAVDVMPTLLELSGIEVPEEVQGRSLLPLLREDGEVQRASVPAFVTRAATDDFFGPPPREKESYAMVRDGWKLVHNVQPVGDEPEMELYDRRSDREELHDVADQHPDRVREMAEVLTRWRARVESERLPSDEEAEQSLSSEEIERLRSLGYLQ